jgi:hypothetical protein
MTSYPETLTVTKLIKMGFFVIKIYYISSSDDPNITHSKNRICGSASTTARSKILFESPKFLFPHKISLPLKRWKKSRKFRQFETNVSWTLREIEYHYIAWNFGQAFKSSHHESIWSTYWHIFFMLIQGRRVLDNCGGVGWQKVLNDKFWNL